MIEFAKALTVIAMIPFKMMAAAICLLIFATLMCSLLMAIV